ncbi:MAG: DUF3108 domain-containing protein [Verrucomicrobiota bacterium JB022]|nr:DUF3108 domain-containing protein [Verrucomicrobiota bacterium JB022]
MMFSPQRHRLWGLLCAVFALCISAGAQPVLDPAARQLSDELAPLLGERPIPFKAGEELHYKIGWGIFAVGTAVIKTEKAEWEGQPAWKFTMQARTNSFADKFYKVRNEATSYTDLGLTRSLHYVNSQREGGSEKDTLFEFDWDENRVRYQNVTDGTIREWIAVPDHIYDVIGLTFLLRTLPLDLGAELSAPTTNGKEVMLSTVEVTKKEEKKFRIGKYDTVLVEPNVKDLGGVFKKSDGASIYFWFSDDKRQLPLRMESEVAVGSFWVELEKVVLPDDTVIEKETDLPRRRR